ncbi:MAG: hypothetical protein E6Q97_24430 [Desulfurellales bacterium]|nr:MAG: hypothetical protein E6Q97_24430 [Desulfurellales bacterium]
MNGLFEVVGGLLLFLNTWRAWRDVTVNGEVTLSRVHAPETVTQKSMPGEVEHLALTLVMSGKLLTARSEGCTRHRWSSSGRGGCSTCGTTGRSTSPGLPPPACSRA